MDWNIKLPETEIEEGLVKCSFCNSSQIREDDAFTGPDVVICHGCVRLLAVQVEASSDHLPDPGPGAEPENPRTCNFCQRQLDFAGAIFAANEKNVYVCFGCVTGFAGSLGQGVG
jgi:ClpX C4-type zinc finger